MGWSCDCNAGIRNKYKHFEGTWKRVTWIQGHNFGKILKSAEFVIKLGDILLLLYSWIIKTECVGSRGFICFVSNS